MTRAVINERINHVYDELAQTTSSNHAEHIKNTPTRRELQRELQKLIRQKEMAKQGI